MTDYTVTIQEEAEGEGEAAPVARSTVDLEEALDWFTNAVEEVMDGESEVTFAALAVDGVPWGLVRENGIDAAPSGDGETAPLKVVAGGRR